MRVVAILAIGLPLGLTPAACGSEQVAPERWAFFEQRIRPLFVRHCYACHSAQANPPKGGLRLDRQRGLQDGGDRGPAIVVGKPAQSLLIAALSHEHELKMPPAGKLSARDLKLLNRWVAMGASMPPDRPSSLQRSGDRSGRTLWSLRPPRSHTLPTSIPHPQALEPLDAFVLAHQATRGLQAMSAADRETLIRRLSFDLLGLPPVPAEVDRFKIDRSADAYERLVDRLLASPHYGERWGRFWLDLARYTDTTASWLKSTAQAYLYRDWIVDALNRDLPYDMLVRQQLAADQVPDRDPDDLAALGFLGLSPTYWKELQLAPNVIRTVIAEEWEERVNTVTRTFLGLTVACARCHDHKFDPIDTADYYALAGVFASAQLSDLPLLPPAETKVVVDAHDRVAKLQRQIDALQGSQNKPAKPASRQRQIAALKARIKQITQGTPHYDTRWVHAVEEASVFVLPDGPHRSRLELRPGRPRDLAIQHRGNPGQTGRTVPRRFLAILSEVSPPRPFTHGSGRLELADAILNEGRPLSSRVIVNRYWKWHFGRGLVTTPSNLGFQGSRPSHPHLLDHLSLRLVENGWSLKWLQRRILGSGTYRRSSSQHSRQYEIDPENRWLWRASRRRLDIEACRDAMLAVAGNGDFQIGGDSRDLSATDHRRRTLYGTINRRDVHTLLSLFDFPDPTAHSPGRETTTTPLQQLFVLNSDFLVRQSDALARRMEALADASRANRIDAIHLLLFSRLPSPLESTSAASFLAEEAAASSQHQAWQRYAQVLLGSNAFQFVD